MPTTRRQFLVQAAGGLLLASAAAHAQLPGNVYLTIPSGCSLFVAPDYLVTIGVTIGFTKYPFLVSSTAKEVTPVSNMQMVGGSTSHPISISVRAAHVTGSTAPQDLQIRIAGPTTTLVHKNNQGTEICRATVSSTFNALKGLVTLTFAPA